MKYARNNENIEKDCQTKDNGLYIKIKDNGFGISEKNIHTVFNKFERGDAVKRKEVKGFGLGLSYVEKIAKAHQGFVSLESKINKGSTFTIFIPINY